MSARLAVAGLGWLGESLLKDLPRAGDFTLSAVQDVAPDRARLTAETYAAPHAVTSFDDLLRIEALDAIAICTPNGLHAAQAQAALAAGLDVLVQKPLALSHSDAVATIAAAERTGRLLVVDYTYRFLETMRVFRTSVQRVGPPRSIAAQFHNIYGPGVEKTWFFDRAQSGGGALTDLGVHLIDLALWLVSPRVARLDDVSMTVAGPVESAAHVRIDLDGVPFNLAVSWNAPLPASVIALEVQGEHGVMRWENVDGSFFRFRTLVDGVVVVERETTLREDTLRAFADALRTRSAPPIDARVYALLDQAYARAPIPTPSARR